MIIPLELGYRSNSIIFVKVLGTKLLTIRAYCLVTNFVSLMLGTTDINNAVIVKFSLLNPDIITHRIDFSST